MDKILYFPTISIPQTSWLMKAMFYWDKIGSIVPLEFLENPSHLEVNMRKLVKYQLIEQVVPENYLWNINDFEKEFLNFIDNVPGINSNNFINLNEHQKLINSKKIHMGKLRNLGNKLEKRGLAIKGNESWYFIETTTASYFMTYLATILGSIIGYKPITDSYNELVHFLPIQEVENKRELLKEQLRTKIFENILPVPDKVEDLYDIFRFKEKHYDKLTNFRRHIEKMILELELMPEYQIEERIKLFTEGAKDEIENISSDMRAFKWENLNLTTFCSLSSSALSVASTNPESSALGFTSAGLGLLSAIGSVVGNDANQELLRSPLAYAAILEKEYK